MGVVWSVRVWCTVSVEWSVSVVWSVSAVCTLSVAWSVSVG